MMAMHRWLRNWNLAGVGTLGALAALVVFHAANNWRWLTTKTSPCLAGTCPLFGVSVDVGTMVNVLYLALLIGSVYGIGQRLGGRRVGLLAAFVVATFPMTYAISRYFYFLSPIILDDTITLLGGGTEVYRHYNVFTRNTEDTNSVSSTYHTLH